MISLATCHLETANARIDAFPGKQDRSRLNQPPIRGPAHLPRLMLSYIYSNNLLLHKNPAALHHFTTSEFPLRAAVSYTPQWIGIFSS